MTRPVIGTIGTRVALALANLLTVMAASHHLGAGGVGTISLIVLGITLVLLLNNVVGGGGLVYLTSRHGTHALRWPAYGWAVVTLAAALLVLHLLPLVPEPYIIHTAALAFLQSICTIHLGLLLGRERIQAHNGLLVLQAVLLLGGFLWFLQQGTAEVMDHIRAGYLANGSTALLSGIISRDGRPTGHPQRPAAVLRALFHQGGMAQAANGLQLVNYRFTYYIIESQLGSSFLGIYAITTQLAESTWLVPKSMGQVLYARVSNLRDQLAQRDLTLTALKASTAIALVAVGVLVLLPDAVYREVFGGEITGLPPLLLLLAPGLIAMAASQAISHYLSGTGHVRHNTIGSGIGTLFTVVLGLLLVPRMGLTGAAITASSAYSASVLYQWMVFRRMTGLRALDLLPHAGDVDRLRALWKKALGR